jgi:ABC-2 type transport system permease protein
LIGVVPGAEEIWRLFIYFVLSILYISFWLGISILFSVIFRSTATSALASLAVWIFFSFFLGLGSGFLADAIAPVQGSSVTPEMVLKHAQVQKIVSSISPMILYSDATSTILDPMRKTTSSLLLMGPLERLSLSRFQNPLPLLQSLYIVLPHLVSLVAITLLCFGICYAVFMRQEVRTI